MKTESILKVRIFKKKLITLVLIPAIVLLLPFFSYAGTSVSSYMAAWGMSRGNSLGTAGAHVERLIAEALEETESSILTGITSVSSYMAARGMSSGNSSVTAGAHAGRLIAEATDETATVDVISPVSIELSYGFENNAKGGRYMPLNIIYTNTGIVDFDGSISIYSRESDDRISEYRNEIILARDQSMKVTYYIPLGISATSLHLKLNDNDGNTFIDRDINLGIDANNAQLFVGVLSDTPERLSYFNDVSLHYGLLRSRAFTLDADSFPRQSRGLDMLDVIIISNYKIRNLDEAQSHALMEWVSSGGVLVLGTGARIDDTLGRYAPELLDDMYEMPEICDVNFSTGPDMGRPDSEYVEIHCAEVDMHGGNVVAQDNGLPLLIASNKENGLIVVSAYDFADTADYASRHKTYPVDVLSACLGEDRMDYLAGEVYGSDNTRYDSISALVSTGDLSRIPPIGIYALSIAAFILLAGPVLYLFLKQRSFSALYRVGVVILSVFFTIIIYLVGSRTRFDNTFYNFSTIIEADEDTVAETTFLNLRNPYNKKYSVSVSPEYTVYPVRKNTAVIRTAEDWSDPIDVSTLIARAVGGVNITVGEVGAFNPQYFSMEKAADNESGAGFSGEVNIYGNELKGEISNNFDYDVTDAAMIFFGKVVKLGDIPRGQTVRLDDLKVVNVPLSSGREVAGLLSEDEEKAGVIAFYRDMYVNGYSTDVRVIGFKNEDRAAADEMVRNADINGRGLTMVSSTLYTYNYSDDRLYQSVLVKGPAVISGDYDYRLNTMTVGAPCVLEYHLGGDMQLLNVIFEWADPASFSRLFTGSVSLYNYSTGAYDKLDTDKTVYDMDSLSQYLSPSNTITARYSYEGDAPVGEKVALPMVCVVGTEADAHE